ncbi:hypothetical protein K432DRAFT_142838 [Lepidopterella palustris CBS 459.81]|uniref:Uncharacterized protein n=1 Tax=Lepidopterella palustris CBS 459.81 TaxID=1314670 RepID=A0A8E2E344_9PEZI|nr:hypothetical protein K432DRAFT_142838 [Lepidopterella palustris CBS 459.81]
MATQRTPLGHRPLHCHSARCGPQRLGRYSLYNNKTLINGFRADYFCIWLYDDFGILGALSGSVQLETNVRGIDGLGKDGYSPVVPFKHSIFPVGINTAFETPEGQGDRHLTSRTLSIKLDDQFNLGMRNLKSSSSLRDCLAARVPCPAQHQLHHHQQPRQRTTVHCP